jgi:hypothetical protein
VACAPIWVESCCKRRSFPANSEPRSFARGGRRVGEQPIRSNCARNGRRRTDACFTRLGGGHCSGAPSGLDLSAVPSTPSHGRGRCRNLAGAVVSWMGGSMGFLPNTFGQRRTLPFGDLADRHRSLYVLGRRRAGYKPAAPANTIVDRHLPCEHRRAVPDGRSIGPVALSTLCDARCFLHLVRSVSWRGDVGDGLSRVGAHPHLPWDANQPYRRAGPWLRGRG